MVGLSMDGVKARILSLMFDIYFDQHIQKESIVEKLTFSVK